MVALMVVRRGHGQDEQHVHPRDENIPPHTPPQERRQGIGQEEEVGVVAEKPVTVAVAVAV